MAQAAHHQTQQHVHQSQGHYAYYHPTSAYHVHYQNAGSTWPLLLEQLLVHEPDGTWIERSREGITQEIVVVVVFGNWARMNGGFWYSEVAGEVSGE